MQIWMEIIGLFPQREGKYLICPIDICTMKNYPKYRIMEEIKIGDLVFHYVLQRASKNTSAFTSYSRIASKFYISNRKDPLCSYLPPYRKIDLCDNTPLAVPITMEMLLPHRAYLEKICQEAPFTRTPFNKNFKIKQLYLARIPVEFIQLFSKLSHTQISLIETKQRGNTH